MQRDGGRWGARDQGVNATLAGTLSLEDHPPIEDGEVHPYPVDLGRRDLEQVPLQHHQIRQLPDLDGTARPLLEGKVSPGDRVGVEGSLEGDPFLRRPRSGPRYCRTDTRTQSSPLPHEGVMLGITPSSRKRGRSAWSTSDM